MPAVRRSLARAHQSQDSTALPARATINVGLTLQARQDGSGVAAVSGNINLQLYGPGDIIGIDSRLIVRTDPKPHAHNFEPNYLATVEFDPPDFPWLLTPARANTHDNLRPWLVLVVLEETRSAIPRVRAGRPLPSISLTTVQVAQELPDLAESHLFAHAQAVSTEEQPTAIAALLKQMPERNISRLVCPRRLKPQQRYVACVVPAFEAGRIRGLGGAPADGVTLTDAWSHARPAALELPVYYHWHFSTGPVGDIETLARRLKTPDMQDTEFQGRLKDIGQRKVLVDDEHLLHDPGVVGQPAYAMTLFEGALVAEDFRPAPAAEGLVKRLEAILNSGERRTNESIAAAEEKAPTLSPPIYGEHPARRHKVDRNGVANHWLDELNLQPRYRLVAGWGSEVVRTFQNEFMQAAWTQVGEVLAAERALSLARFACDVLVAIERRHLAKLPESRLLSVTAPARARLKLGPDETLFGRIEQATLPDELFSGAMRRLTSARRPLLRSARWRHRDRALPSILQQMNTLVATFADAERHVEAIDPNHFVPDGIIGSRTFDLVPIPADPDAMVDLSPYLGIAAQRKGREIKRLVEARQEALTEAATMRRKLPRMGDIARQGVITETHYERVAQLQRAAGVRLSDVEVAKLVAQVGADRPDGVLLTAAPSGHVVAQALQINARDGTVQIAGRARGADHLTRRIAARDGVIGAAPRRALRLYGAQAVFRNLPAGVVNANDRVQLELQGPGRFRRATPIEAPPEEAEGIAATITLPPAITEPAVVERYSVAFEKFSAQYVNPLDELELEIRPVPFAVPAAATQVRARMAPSTTVPRRLASTLSLGGSVATFTPGSGLQGTFISPRHDLALVERLRYVVPPTFDRVMAYPHLRLPISKKLEVLAPDVFLPGAGDLPEDFIMTVKTNPRFVEAVMLGVNHEMNRELLWQGFPTDQRGTPFQHFWQRLDGRVDIDAVHKWDALALGHQPFSTEMLVLLIRGQLLERFPNLSIYAYPKGAAELRPGESEPRAAGQSRSEMAPAKILLPVLRGHLGRDITYVGFNIKPLDRDRYFFILEEHMTEPRFGFDESNGDDDADSWLDVHWGHLNVDAGNYFGAVDLRRAPPATARLWAHPHAAIVAQALLQRPFRGYYAGAKLRTP
jgi:hypothetical protein